MNMSGLARLRIVAINDVYELHNLPKLQTFLSRLSYKPSAVTLAGDFLSPSTLSSVDGGRGMVATLRATGLTHVSLGNHEQVSKSHPYLHLSFFLVVIHILCRNSRSGSSPRHIT